MGGKRKRINKLPTTSLVRTPNPILPMQYDFQPRATTSKSLPPVLPKNNPQPSVRDYPPPRKLFPTSTFPPSGSAPVPQSRQNQSSAGEASSMHASEQRQSPAAPVVASPVAPLEETPAPPHEESPAPPLDPSPSGQLRGAPSPHSSQAQNSPIPEDFAEVQAPVQPDLSDDLMIVLNELLSQPGREQYTTVLSRNLEPGTTW